MSKIYSSEELNSFSKETLVEVILSVYYGENVPPVPEERILRLSDCYLQVYLLSAGFNPYTSCMDL